MPAPMLKVEVDGRQVEVPHGTMVMDAANKLGIYVPHFCYHKKLTIAANCRMCLVQIEKAPKPMPACATPVTDGMKVFTTSEQAKKAQAGVMEFLLINHPLDCPICDQGGECQLQDLAVGYGGSGSRFAEEKRVVAPKDIGPLVAAEEMSRCIQCTRCIRFGQEVAGVMELGMIGRGEHSEIVSFVGKTVDSELSGNMIDICPVGALTSKPFRYAARTWELTRRKSVSPHDSLGSNLIVQTKLDRVLRVLPQENESINECWLSDRDRFSYEGLDTDRLTAPMIKEAGVWKTVDWQVAFEHVVPRLKAAGARLGALGSAQATLEELYLLARLARGLGSENVDFRTRHADNRADPARVGVPYLGMPIASISLLDRALVVGSFLRKDHPLLANRFRQAAKRGMQLSMIHCADDEQLMPIAGKAIVRPSALVATLAQLARAVIEAKGGAVPAMLASITVGNDAKAIAASLASGSTVGVFLGNLAVQHPQAAELQRLAQMITAAVGGRCGVLGEGANSVGGYLAGCVPGAGGLGANAMLREPRDAYLLFGVEPELDAYDSAQAQRALRGAELVVALTAFKGRIADYAHVMLPIAPFTETSGTYVNTEGRMQSFNAAVKPQGEARPGWKVLRVLGTMLGLPGFDFDTSEAVRDAASRADAVAARLDSRISGDPVIDAGASGIERVTDVPIYFADPLVRRAAPLQQTRDAAPPRAAMNVATAARIGVAPGGKVRLKQVSGEAVLECAIDDGLPEDVVRVPAGHASTAALGPMFGPILSLERA